MKEAKAMGQRHPLYSAPPVNQTATGSILGGAEERKTTRILILLHAISLLTLPTPVSRCLTSSNTDKE